MEEEKIRGRTIMSRMLSWQILLLFYDTRYRNRAFRILPNPRKKMSNDSYFISPKRTLILKDTQRQKSNLKEITWVFNIKGIICTSFCT